MDKQQLMEICQVAILNFEGMQYKDLVDLDLKPQNIAIGIKLLNFLQEKLKPQTWQPGKVSE